ncbi:hypothetical protein K438DRAFT_1959290 [Mycena galopus ATCC 62051]|nr:hypothetical protein K438DRAFT_1959290 [Mycena galopus ATCC 62051]
MDLKFCFAASGDIRNIIMTVNDLPDNYTGKCSILCNDRNSIVVNRNLVILFVLLTAGANVADAAELATHLMYSAALTPAMAAYVHQCIETIYGTHGPQSGVWDTRGAGRICSLQWMPDIQLALQMFRSKYKLPVALASMHSVMWSPERVDYRDRYLSTLEPNHRLAFSRFRTTGVLAPFSVDVSHFTEPNRRWMAHRDLGPVFNCGKRYGATRGDPFGCLFFYLKEQFQKFATRAKQFTLDLTLSQADAAVLSQAVPAGLVRNFYKARFDRIETSNLADYIGASKVIENWAPLLNKANSHSVLLMNFMNWPLQKPHSRFQDNARNMTPKRMEQAAAILGFSLMEVAREGKHSPKMINILECMEAFYDNEPPFSEFLKNAGAYQAAAAAGAGLREIHRIHPKRSGLALNNPSQKIPNLTKTEFNDLCDLYITSHDQPTQPPLATMPLKLEKKKPYFDVETGQVNIHPPSRTRPGNPLNNIAYNLVETEAGSNPQLYIHIYVRLGFPASRDFLTGPKSYLAKAAQLVNATKKLLKASNSGVNRRLRNSCFYDTWPRLSLLSWYDLR